MFTQLTPAQLINSTRSAFWIPGFAAASWAPFIPYLKDRLSLSEDHLGYIIMFGAIGAGATLLFANRTIARYGCRAIVRLCGIIIALCLVSITLADSVYTLCFLLFLFGMNSEFIAICANVNAAAIEKYLDRSLMSGFHGIYSLGNAAGVFLVASMLSAGLSFIGGHMLLTAACVSLLVLVYCSLVASRNMITDLHAVESYLNELQVQRGIAKQQAEEKTAEEAKDDNSQANTDLSQANADEAQTTAEQQAKFEQSVKVSLEKTATPENSAQNQPNTLEQAKQEAAQKKHSVRDFFHPILFMLGFMCFVMFMTEGSMMDWTGVFLNQFRGVEMSEAGYGFAAFATMMTLCRLTGDRVVTALGRKRVLTIGGLLVTTGICLAVMVPSSIVAIFGFGLVGIGASNIVPQCVSYAATVKSLPLHRSIFIVNALGYIGGLFGPALIGFLAHRIGLDVTFMLLSCGTAVVALAAYLKVKSGSVSSIEN